MARSGNKETRPGHEHLSPSSRRQTGKVVAFIAGVTARDARPLLHSRVIGRIDPALAGSVIVAPLLNVPSFEQMTVHVNRSTAKE
jgi:hypothetical protein